MVDFGACLRLDPPWGQIANTTTYASTLEQLGYDCIWCGDERFERDVYITLSLAASSTHTVKLGTCVTNPYMRHPLTTSVAISTLNELSGGRAILGISAGGSSMFEQQQMARSYPPLLALREAMAVIRSMFSGKKTEYLGKTMKFRGANLDFDSKPIPIYIAARGPKLFQLAGELADGVIIGSLASHEGIRFAIENLEKGARRSHRSLKDIDIVFWAYTAIADDQQRAKELVKRIVIASMWSSKSILKYIGIDNTTWKPLEGKLQQAFSSGFSPEQAYALVANQLPDEILNAWTVAGNTETVLRRSKEIIHEGIGQLALIPFGKNKAENQTMLTIFARKIMPELKNL